MAVIVHPYYNITHFVAIFKKILNYRQKLNYINRINVIALFS